MMHHTPGHSPVALADCKITTCGDGPLCVDVRFNTKEQLDDLVEALSLLRDATDFVPKIPAGNLNRRR